MSNAAKIAVPTLLLAAVAGGAFYFLSGGEIAAPVAPPVVTPAEPRQPVPQEPTKPVQAPIQTAVVQQGEVRTEAKASDTHANADARQGVKGRVLRPDGTPAAQVPVFLMENSMNDPIKIFLMNKSGTRTPPVSSGKTAEDGTFALGVITPGKAYDLRVVSDEHPEINHQQIKVREDDWFDTLDLKLELGMLVTGRVVDETTKAAIRDASVFLASSNQAHAMVATPGRERGIVAVTDQNGGFRFANAPRQGLINLNVEAPEYASAQVINQQLKPDQPNEFTIELVRGQPIAGVVVDADGKPIAGVNITASGLSAKTPQTATTVSLTDGTFHFASLREGPYQLLTSSTQYNETKTPPVMTGELEVKIVIAQRAYAKLRVRGANQAAVKSFSLSLKRSFPNNPLGIGNVPEFADRRINPSDYPAEFRGEWAVIRGLPPGEFVFQVQDQNHAKTLSPAFKVADGGEAPEVDMVLTVGASITGTVVDDAGRPVAGATVSTDMNGAFSADGGFFEIFKNFIPEKHSKASAKTDAQGRFRIGKLAFADYMVRVAHSDFCEGSQQEIKLETEGQVVDTGTIQLARGAYVEGTTTVGGQPVGQVKITVSVPQPEGLPQADPQNPRPMKAMFSASAISDNDGRFRLLKRVPPGNYKINASRPSGDNNPFMILLDMKETEQQLQVNPGQDRIQMDFNLPKR